jgi:hypothetical protein
VPERAVDRSSDNPFTPRDAVVGDFFAPFFTIRFLSQEIQQGQNVDGDTGQETDAVIDEAGSLIFQNGESTTKFSEDSKTTQFRSYATSLQVTNQGGGCCMVELRLEPPLDDALVMIEHKLVQFNTVLVVEWGWTTNGGQDTLLSDKHYFMTMPPKMDVKGTDVTITITGIDIFGYSSMKRETRKIYRRTAPPANRTFVRPNASTIGTADDPTIYDTDFKILEALAKKNNMRLNSTLAPVFFEKTVALPFGLTIQVPEPSGLPIHKVHPVDDKDATSVEQNEKDWMFFKRICETNRCDYFTIGDAIYIVDQNIARAQPYAYRLVFWNQPQQTNDIPIYSFSTEVLPQMFMPAEAKEVFAKSADEDEGQTKNQRVDPLTSSEMEAMGKRGAGGKSEADGRMMRVTDDTQIKPNPSYADDETGRMMSIPGGLANREETVLRIARDANSLCNTNMEVSIPGVPGLVPMQIVSVVGCSKIFSGPYLVLKVVHKITTDGYDCDVTLIRESSTGDDEAGRGQTPKTGGNDPKKGEDQQGVDPVDGTTGLPTNGG